MFYSSSKIFWCSIFIVTSFQQLIPTIAQDIPVKCHALTFNGDLNCSNQTDYNSTETNKCGEPQHVGTITKFKCKAHYVLHEANPGNTHVHGNDFMEEEMKCGENGTWIGYERFKSYHCREVCGRRLTNPKPLIINGVATNTTSWPWHAAIFRKVGMNTHYICGGTIIRKTAILTAAHCVTSAVGGPISPNSTVIVLGAVSNNFTENQLSPEVQIFNVKQIFVSESYDVKKEYQADIAILHLDRNVEYSDYISPVCLPLPNDATIDSSNVVQLGKLGDVVGFGVDESKSLSTHLKHGQLEIKSHSDCFVKMQRILTESQICAGSQRGESWVTVCNGDSGGGLVLPSVIHEKYYIHGVVSSGENIEAGKEPCQNYAVFTRVFSFISWIREVLEEISGDVDLELAATTTFPYIQSETETRRREFLPIPKDWKNKVASVELSNVDIVPEVLLKSLEYCKTAHSINFTQVKFKNEFSSRKVRLPQLKSISMDILRDDFVVSNDRSFPQDFTQDFLKSLVFFEKDINDVDVDISTIAQMRTNFDITIHIFKSLVINHEEGKIVLSQITFTNEILANLPKSDFLIRDLALSRCSLSIENGLLVNQTQIEKLILDHVDFPIVELTDFLKTLNNLQEFVLVSAMNTNVSIDVGVLPKTLKHLALSHSILNLPTVLDDEPEQFHPSAIVFPDFKPNTNFRRTIVVTDSNALKNVETFYCNLCLPKEISLMDLSAIFPNLKQVVLKLNQTSDNLDNFLKALKHLEMAFITYVESGQPSSRKFITENGKLIEKQIPMNENFESTHLDFEFTRKSNFWTNEVDYIGLARSSTTERNAFNTGHYNFNGQLFPLPDGTHPPVKNGAEERFPTVPIHIQERLETIEINNAEILRENIEESLKSCKWIKHIRMTNVSTPDPIFRNVVELPELVEYNIKTIAGLVPPLFGYKGFAAYINKVFHLFFPFKQEGFNVPELFISSKIRRIHFQYGECVGVSWDADEGTLISASDKTNNWFKHLNLNQTDLVKKFAFKFQELEIGSLPKSITHLNLNFAIVKNVGSLLERLTTLKDLRLVNVRAQDTDIYSDWEWPKINVTYLALHSDTLKYLAIEKSHILNFNPGISFKKLRTVYFEDLAFDNMDFADNFNTIFPNVKNLVVLASNNHNTLSVDMILLNALKHENVKWILSKLNSISESEKSQVRTEVENILNSAGVNEVSQYFIIEKIHGSWIRTNANLVHKQFKSKLNMIKGTSVFGTTWSCHAYTFAEGASGNNNSL